MTNEDLLTIIYSAIIIAIFYGVFRFLMWYGNKPMKEYEKTKYPKAYKQSKNN